MEVFDLKKKITDDDHEQVREETLGPGGLAGAAPEDEASMEAAAQIRKEALEAFELGACTIRTKEALVALEDGRNLTPEGNKRVLERWRLERENSDLELAEMQVAAQ